MPMLPPVVPPGYPIDAAGAGGLLANWGFLAEPDLPDRPGPAWLLVAIRPVPTLRHFDPEVIEFWVTEKSRGRHAMISHETPMPVERPFSWGLIRIVDRFKVSNEYLTFGGNLVAEAVDDAVVAVFTSPAPLLRRAVTPRSGTRRRNGSVRSSVDCSSQSTTNPASRPSSQRRSRSPATPRSSPTAPPATGQAPRCAWTNPTCRR